MKTALFIYILLGVLSIVPLVAFNIRKIWVRRPPDPIRFKPVRFGVILVICLFIGTFLTVSYQMTMKNRFEIFLERVATEHSRVLVGDQSWDDFKAFVLENGSDGVGEGLDEIPEPASSCDEVRFQISKEYTPKYWNGAEGFATVEDVEDNNPRYLMYKLAAGDETRYYALRLRRIGEDWVIEWFGEANDIQIKKISMPSEINGKWFTVRASGKTGSGA